MAMLNAMKAKKITERKEKRYLRKKQKKDAKILKEIHKEIQKGILTAINNGQYKYNISYRYNYGSDLKTENAFSVLANEEYLKEYYQALGYIIKIKDTGLSARVEIFWMEEE